MNLLVLLQSVTPVDVAEVANKAAGTTFEESYLSLIMKGGWILLPIFILSILAIYVIVNKWFIVNSLGRKNPSWMLQINQLIYEGKIDKAIYTCAEKPSASAQVIAAGLREIENSEAEVQEAMEIEARQQVVILENQMNYLGITASIAPMLGFLGTIFGVIKIFYDIARTNDLSIDVISTGLYQKMICSGAGLLVGIIAYSGYYILNGRIDKVIANVDKDSNEALKVIRAFKKRQA